MPRFLPFLFVVSTAAFAQETAVPPLRPPASDTPLPNGAVPFDKLITKDAISKAGLFTVHKLRDKYYLEIPKSELNKDFLWITKISKTTKGAGYGSQPLTHGVVRWVRSGDKINLVSVNYDVVADPAEPIAAAVAAANNDSVLFTFPIAAFGKDGTDNHMLIEVSKLFSTDVPEFSARSRLQATALDPARSWIERISPYPSNIEVESSMTYIRAAPPPGLPAPPPHPVFGPGMRAGSGTIVLHHSIVKLPENPMRPRLHDNRLNYLGRRMMDYSSRDHRAVERRFIVRWRLEKKDPSASLSEPVKPIVYYIDAATPAKYVPYLKAGVESWQKAFEAAGFRNAIIAKPAPSAGQDPGFSPEDARYSFVRWVPSTMENAFGPNIHDPRTGEILQGDVQISHNVMNMVRMWYFVQASPLDSRAQRFPFPDELVGRLVRYICEHEVGHTLGFDHNLKASSTYPQEKVRDREWVRKMGHSPSIMDYSRFNYVAQPEDRLDPADLIPQVGPYDLWATRWGYAPIPDASSPEEEKPVLDRWAREQDSIPWYRHATQKAAGSDPGELAEAVGDDDAIQSTALGLKNLERVSKCLIPATTTSDGDNFDLLAEVYGRLLGQWTLEMNHVATIVGGFLSRQKHVGQQGRLFTPVPKSRQAAAVQFLVRNAFHLPAWLSDPEILRRIEPVGQLVRVRNAQVDVMNNLLSSARFARLVEQEPLDGPAAFSPAQLLAAVRGGLWTELDAPKVRIDAYRRNLQRAFLDTADARINGPKQSASSGDEPQVYRAELIALDSALAAASAKPSDELTRAHIEYARHRIARILDPRFYTPLPPAAPAPRPLGVALLDTCWPPDFIQPY